MSQSTLAPSDGPGPYPETLAYRETLERQILEAPLDRSLVQVYAAFRSHGGEPTPAMQDRLRLAILNTEAAQNVRYTSQGPSASRSEGAMHFVQYGNNKNDTHQPAAREHDMARELFIPLVNTAVNTFFTIVVSLFQNRTERQQAEATRLARGEELNHEFWMAGVKVIGKGLQAWFRKR